MPLPPSPTPVVNAACILNNHTYSIYTWEIHSSDRHCRILDNHTYCHFWDLFVLQLLRPDSSVLPCLYSTFHLEYPLVLSRFCSLLNLHLENTLQRPSLHTYPICTWEIHSSDHHCGLLNNHTYPIYTLEIHSSDHHCHFVNNHNYPIYTLETHSSDHH